MKPSIALLNVLEERDKQDAKWGQQDHVPLKWMMILQEELGEAAKAILEADDEWDESKYRDEMVQVAAVALAAVESYDRRQGTWTCPVKQVLTAFGKEK